MTTCAHYNSLRQPDLSYWVAVEELKSSYHDGAMYLASHYSNLN